VSGQVDAASGGGAWRSVALGILEGKGRGRGSTVRRAAPPRAAAAAT
jgi:hypothetical protein